MYFKNPKVKWKAVKRAIPRNLLGSNVISSQKFLSLLRDQQKYLKATLQHSLEPAMQVGACAPQKCAY